MTIILSIMVFVTVVNVRIYGPTGRNQLKPEGGLGRLGWVGL